jgi:3-hydroxyisobutyrate dehydrogenase-like beta-hydroxyacid dehydrogenase
MMAISTPPSPLADLPSVGVIGLGIIGSRVSQCLRNAGYPVFCWSRTPRPEMPGCQLHPRAVAEQAQVVQLFVRDDSALAAAMQEMHPVLTPVHVIMNHATVSPEAVHAAAAVCADAGAAFLDAPFTGSKMAAEAGQLVYYIGGEAAVLERVRPVLQCSAKDILHLGAIGEATVLKIASNLISAVNVLALGEAVDLVAGQDIPIEKLAAALRVNANFSPLMDLKLKTLLHQDFSPHFSVGNMLKDARLAQALAFSPTPGLDAAAESLQILADTDRAGLDYAAMVLAHDALDSL